MQVHMQYFPLLLRSVASTISVGLYKQSSKKVHVNRLPVRH